MPNPPSSRGERSPLLEPPPAPVPSSEIQGSDDDVTGLSVTKLRTLCIMMSLGLLIFLQATNFSILTTTQSRIAEDLDSFDQASWFTSAYLISMSSVSPLAGRLSQLFSPRHCVFVASILFSLGSIVTSQASRLSIFLLGRSLTGLGAAGVLTLCIILIIQIAPEQRRGLFFGCINANVTTGVSLGAILGGALLGPVGWRGIFGIQAVLAIMAGLGVFFSLPKALDSHKSDHGSRPLKQKLLYIDYLGAILLTSSLVLLLTGLSSPRILFIPIGISAGLFIIFVLNEMYTSDPVIPVSLLKSRGVLLTCLAQLGLMMSRWLVLFYTPFFALAVWGWSPASAGSILVPTNAGFALGGLVVGVLHVKRAGSFYAASLVSTILFPVTLALLAELTTKASPVFAVIAAIFLNGFVTGAVLNYTLAHLLHLTPSQDHPIATSLLGTFRGFSGSFGSAIGGGIFARVLRASLETSFADEGMKHKGDLIRRLIGQPELVQNLEGIEKEVARQGYVDAIRTLFMAGVGLATVTIVIQSGTGWIGVASKQSNSNDSAGEHSED